MRITLVSAFDPNPAPASEDAGSGHVGGVERVFCKISQALARRGHDVTLVCSTHGSGGSTKEEGVRIVREPRHTTILRAPLAPLSRHIPPESDVVHVAATYPFTTPAVLRRAHELGIPSVLDFHFEPDPGTAVGRLAANVYQRVAPPVYNLASSVLVRSIAYGRSAASLDGIPEGQWRVVPNGVDPSRFRPLGQRAQGDYLLFVGRLIPYKGLDVLMHALARAPPGIPLLIVGDGPLRSHLQALAERLAVDVRFLGHVPDGDLPALYAGACLTVLPSVTRQECFGISLLESMACGTPVVASDLPGVAELARLGGLVAKVGDAQDLSAQIKRALQPGLLRRGPALASPIHQEFSWDAVTDRLEAVYKEVVGKNRAPLLVHSPGVRSVADPGGHPLLQP
jgi:glycosyltransferase involved in cell wall biosynthesis